MRFQQAPYRIADVVALLFILHGNTSFGSLAPIIPYRSCKHYLAQKYKKIVEFPDKIFPQGTEEPESPPFVFCHLFYIPRILD